jgi:hypothetical protein
MKPLIIAWIFSSITLKYFAGCNAGKLYWQINHASIINLDATYSNFNINIQSSENDTLQLTGQPKFGCGGWSIVSTYKNNAPFNPLISSSISGNVYINIKCEEGEYDITLFSSYYHSTNVTHFSIHPINYVGISELNPSTNFLNVYPNPASKEISIINSTTQILEINIINSLGNLILSAYPTNTEITLNVEELPKGIYYISAILEDKKRVNKKIIIE